MISAVAGARDPGRRRAHRADLVAARRRVSDLGLRCVSAVGLFAMIAIAWLASTDRRRMPWRTVRLGLGLQFALALLLLKTRAGVASSSARAPRWRAHALHERGARFVFGPLLDTGFSFVTHVLPVIVFMGSLFAVLYHLGLVQLVVAALARGCRARCASRAPRASPPSRTSSSA